MCGPTSVNYNVSAVTTAINAANNLSSSLGGLSGTNISFNNSNQTVNESSGTLHTSGGVSYRVFNVTSYSENNADTVTINGDGSGDPVVFNFAYSGNTNLGGQVSLTGGLTDDQVLWNFTSSGKNVNLNNNGGIYQGVILAPLDAYSSDSSNLHGRVYGGAGGNMQIVSGANVYAPPGMLVNTATVSATNVSPVQSTATITISPPGPVVSIAGTKYLDASGNGFSGADTPLGGVTINLYKDANGSGTLEQRGRGAGGHERSPRRTAPTSFTGLPAGTYFVQEVVPSGYVQTGGGPNGSAGDTYYTVAAQPGQTYGGNNFDDFLIPTCTPTSVSFTVNNNNCLTTVSDLRGNTQQGDTVTVTFTVPAGMMNDQLSLVSYIAPGSSFDSSTAYQQQIFDVATGVFTPGTYTLTVLIPNCYYQIDFVCGQAINVLGPTNYGPDGSNIFYSAEGRLLSADNGGTQAFSTKSVASGDFGTTALWTTSNGQNLLNKLNGSSGSTQLAQWLATTLPQPVRVGRRQPFAGQLQRHILHQHPGGRPPIPSSPAATSRCCRRPCPSTPRAPTSPAPARPPTPRAP